MISVVVCSRKEPSWNIHQRNIARTIGTQHEYIRVDNSQNSYGICAAYNAGVERSKGDIIVFVHEDCVFLEQGWGRLLEEKFAADAAVGLIGVAGTQYLFADDLAWHKAGIPFTRGRVLHDISGGERLIMTVFSWEETDSEAVVVDGLFFAVRGDLFKTIRFDQETFDRFHFYDLDICMQVRATHKVVVTTDIVVKHFSGGSHNPDWFAAAEKFKIKYKDKLPASCAVGTPQPKDFFNIQSFDVTGKIPQIIPV